MSDNKLNNELKKYYDTNEFINESKHKKKSF